MTMPPDQVPALSIRAVRKSYASPGGITTALNGVDLDIRHGGFVSLIGPSGCGKSTLLQIMAGLTDATSGEVYHLDKRIDGPAEDVLYVFQQYTRSLFPWLTVGKNIAFGLNNQRGIPRAEIEARTRELSRLVKLTGFEDHYPWQLSGGMQQRVAIARALICRPDVLLMDEPFSAVDALTRVGLQELVRGLWQEFGITIIFVTHDVDEAIYMSERVIALTRSPGTVAIDLEVELPFPRDQIVTRALPNYLDYRAKLLAQLFADEGLASSGSA
jgi:NitT/TauT family transport system ATP-binding protein